MFNTINYCFSNNIRYSTENKIICVIYQKHKNYILIHIPNHEFMPDIEDDKFSADKTWPRNLFSMR